MIFVIKYCVRRVTGAVVDVRICFTFQYVDEKRAQIKSGTTLTLPLASNGDGGYGSSICGDDGGIIFMVVCYLVDQ